MTNLLVDQPSYMLPTFDFSAASMADDRIDQQRRCRRIVVLLNGTGLAERAIPPAMVMARDSGAELILVHVYQPRGIERVHDLMLPADTANLLAQAQADATRYLQSQCHKLRRQKLTVRGYIIQRENLDAISHVAEIEKPDVVVMVQPRRHWLEKIFRGDLAAAIRERTGVPVLAVFRGRQF